MNILRTRTSSIDNDYVGMLKTREHKIVLKENCYVEGMTSILSLSLFSICITHLSTPEKEPKVSRCNDKRLQMYLRTSYLTPFGKQFDDKMPVSLKCLMLEDLHDAVTIEHFYFRPHTLGLGQKLRRDWHLLPWSKTLSPCQRAMTRASRTP